MNPNIKIKNLIKTLAKETNEAKKSESMKQYLTLMSKFHNYSYKNQLIIFSQNPKATRIAGIKTWQSLNRKVKKGEKSIKILAPIIKDEEILNFRPVSVFDISQTEGQELKDIEIAIKGNTHQDLLNKLIRLTNKENIQVEFKDLKEGLFGYCNNNNIVINKNHEINTQVNTLVHELAHYILHKNKELTKITKEVQAEAVAFVVLNYFNLETKSFNYLAIYDANEEIILENLKVISETSKGIINQILNNNSIYCSKVKFK